ncbi:MAG: hypothetical protein ACLUSP_00020 [Christensenellales bacterium]
MDVYAELVILDNAAITYLMRGYVSCSLNEQCKAFRRGNRRTAFALVYPITKSVALGWATKALRTDSCAIVAGKKTVYRRLRFFRLRFVSAAGFAIGFAIAGNAASR